MLPLVMLFVLDCQPLANSLLGRDVFEMLRNALAASNSFASFKGKYCMRVSIQRNHRVFYKIMLLLVLPLQILIFF